MTKKKAIERQADEFARVKGYSADDDRAKFIKRGMLADLADGRLTIDAIDAIWRHALSIPQSR